MSGGRGEEGGGGGGGEGDVCGWEVSSFHVIWEGRMYRCITGCIRSYTTTCKYMWYVCTYMYICASRIPHIHMHRNKHMHSPII